MFTYGVAYQLLGSDFCCQMLPCDFAYPTHSLSNVRVCQMLACGIAY